MKLLSLLILFPLTGTAADFVKARRDPLKDFSYYERRFTHQKEEIREISSSPTALRSARIFTTAALPDATSWRQDALQERFEHMRDVRFLKDSNGELRRSSWLFPDDGCYARAALAMRNLFSIYAPLPSKVFAFGNLKVETENSPRGAVHWWYHVAPIVQVKGEKYVLDPALDALKPLKLADWVARMGNPERIKVAICGSGTYSPGDRCHKESDGLEAHAERAQLSYLKEEERRLSRLGRETSMELGDRPPWLALQDR